MAKHEMKQKQQQQQQHGYGIEETFNAQIK